MLDGSPDEFMRQFRAAAAQADERYKRIQDIQERTGQVRVTERSPDGAVEITLDRLGKVIDLRFNDAARRLAPAALTVTAMNCLRSAGARLGGEVERIVREVSGDSKADADRLVERYRRDHPESKPVAPLPIPPPQAAPPQAPPPMPQPMPRTEPIRRTTPAEVEDDEVGPIMRRGYQR